MSDTHLWIYTDTKSNNILTYYLSKIHLHASDTVYIYTGFKTGFQ